jgi:hypothetical protein
MVGKGIGMVLKDRKVLATFQRRRGSDTTHNFKPARKSVLRLVPEAYRGRYDIDT